MQPVIIVKRVNPQQDWGINSDTYLSAVEASLV